MPAGTCIENMFCFGCVGCSERIGAPWHFLNFFPLPQWHGSLRRSFGLQAKTYPSSTFVESQAIKCSTLHTRSVFVLVSQRLSNPVTTASLGLHSCPAVIVSR